MSEVEQRVALTRGTLDFTRDLRDLLEEYHLLRPQATSRAEELQRSGDRNQLEEEILQIVNNWEELRRLAKLAEEPVPDAEDKRSAQAR